MVTAHLTHEFPGTKNGTHGPVDKPGFHFFNEPLTGILFASGPYSDMSIIKSPWKKLVDNRFPPARCPVW
jgi:hypothetical protein